MTKEKIHANLDTMLANPKSKTFLSHLVRAYFPVTNIKKVLDKPEGKFSCAITSAPLVSISEIMEGMESEQYKTDLLNSMKLLFDEKADKVNPLRNLIGDKKLGFTGKDTTTFMSHEACQEFINWVSEKALSGDKHIKWLLGGIRHDAFVEASKNAEAQGIHKATTSPKTKKVTTFSLGDSSDVLAKLKAKMESDGE